MPIYVAGLSPAPNTAMCAAFALLAVAVQSPLEIKTVVQDRNHSDYTLLPGIEVTGSFEPDCRANKITKIKMNCAASCNTAKSIAIDSLPC